MTSWYERNREKAIQNAKTWRLNNLDRFRALNRAAKQRKREGKRQKSSLADAKPFRYLPLAPEGYDPLCGFTIEQWCNAHQVPFDPEKW